MKITEYKIIKYICERCNTEYDESTEIKVCQICGIDMCDSDDCEQAQCEMQTCQIDVCYNCSKIEKESGGIVCIRCFKKENLQEAVL